MMQTSHFSSGALAGKFIPNPALAFGAGILIHFIIDKIPHWWPESNHTKAVFTAIDYLMATIMLISFIYLFRGNMTNMLWGLAGSAVVDILLVGIPQIHKTKLGQWHTLRQPHKTTLKYLWTDIAFTAVCFTLVLL